jgi:hypothetical protein
MNSISNPVSRWLAPKFGNKVLSVLAGLFCSLLIAAGCLFPCEVHAVYYSLGSDYIADTYGGLLSTDNSIDPVDMPVVLSMARDSEKYSIPIIFPAGPFTNAPAIDLRVLLTRSPSDLDTGTKHYRLSTDLPVLNIAGSVKQADDNANKNSGSNDSNSASTGAGNSFALPRIDFNALTSPIADPKISAAFNTNNSGQPTQIRSQSLLGKAEGPILYKGSRERKPSDVAVSGLSLNQSGQFDKVNADLLFWFNIPDSQGSQTSDLEASVQENTVVSSRALPSFVEAANGTEFKDMQASLDREMHIRNFVLNKGRLLAFNNFDQIRISCPFARLDLPVGSACIASFDGKYFRVIGLVNEPGKQSQLKYGKNFEHTLAVESGVETILSEDTISNQIVSGNDGLTRSAVNLASNTNKSIKSASAKVSLSQILQKDSLLNPQSNISPERKNCLLELRDRLSPKLGQSK